MPSLLCGLMSHQVVLSHFVHLNGISPKWILSWVSNLKISSNLKLRSSCTLFALEWLLSCVGPLMFLQVASYWEALVALWAFKRLLSFVGPLMLLQVASYWEALVVLSHFEHLKGFSPVWVLSCSFKELDVEKTCHSLRIWIEFLLSGSSHGFSSNLM